MPQIDDCNVLHKAKILLQWPVNFTQLSKFSKEGNVLFNDTLNTLYLQLYGVRYIVKDHWGSERNRATATWATLSD